MKTEVYKYYRIVFILEAGSAIFSNTISVDNLLIDESSRLYGRMTRLHKEFYG